jgi:Transposase DDE domain group 1
MTLSASPTRAPVRSPMRARQERLPLLVGLLRQSAFGRLAGYEDVNDAEQLCRDPAMRWVVGGPAIQGAAASDSQLGRFDTEWLTGPRTSPLSPICPDRESTRCTRRRQPRVVVLDMKFERKPDLRRTGRQRLQRAFRLHVLSPLFVFNQLGDGTVRAATWQCPQRRRLAWSTGIGRIALPGRRDAVVFRGDAAFANPDIYEFLESKAWGM